MQTQQTPDPGSSGSSDADRELDQVEREIRQLKIEFEKFFNGALDVPPVEMRSRLGMRLKKLRNANVKGVVTGFRLSNLEARFASLREITERRLRQREEGRGPAGRPVREARANRFDPSRGIVFGETVEPAAVEALYDGLQTRPGQGPRFDLDSFRTYLERQARAIRDKTGCSSVQFRIADGGDGHMKLKARPVRSDR
jgi:hypothetical protein